MKKVMFLLENKAGLINNDQLTIEEYLKHWTIEPEVVFDRNAWKEGYYEEKRKRLVIKYLHLSLKRSTNPKLKKKYKRDPLKEYARVAVAAAIKRKELTRLPCEKCGNEKSEGHHENYTKPLEVVWLCKKHHVERHVEMRRKDIPTIPVTDILTGAIN